MLAGSPVTYTYVLRSNHRPSRHWLTYADMAAHYGTAVVPARPYKPRDTVAACPSRDEIADGIVTSSRAVYTSSSNATGSSRVCGCPGDTFTNGVRIVICGSPEAGAIKVATWGYCKREQVPSDLIDKVAATYAACRKGS